jgi:RHS repeat-associated protein
MMLTTFVYDGVPRLVHQCVSTPSRYTGKEHDAESGLDYFGARHYSSTIGRFLSPDPSGLAYADMTDPQSLNLYAYVRNHPLSFIDPNGLECVWDDGSYDSIDDPKTGNGDIDTYGNHSGCSSQGGTWIDHSYFANNGMADWSSKGNQTLADMTVPAAVVTGSAADVPMTGNSFSFTGMTQEQAISMFKQAGFVYSPTDTRLSKITKAHPGVNMRGSDSTCSVHLNILPGSGQNGNPVTGNFHYDLFSPLVPFDDSLSPEGTAAHAAADVVPDLLIDKAGFPKTWTGNHFCVHK